MRKKHNLANKMEKRKKSIMRQYLAILFLACIEVLISFLLTRYIVNVLFIDQSRESANVIFRQMEDNLELFEEDIDKLYTNIASSSAIISFLKAESLAERTEYMDEIQQIVASNMKISRCLDSVSIYNEKDELINSNGNIFLQKPAEMGTSGLVTYTGCLHAKDGSNYFGVAMPVYLLKGVIPDQTLGSVFLVFDVEYLSNILSSSLLNEKSSAAILDEGGEIVVCTNQWMDEYANIVPEDNNEYIINIYPMKASGWRMINVIPTSSLLDGVEYIRQINDITYLILLAALGTICVIVYRKIIKPIRRQIEFMIGYTSNTDNRIDILEYNELGELAQKMNEMLDGIETLNSKIIEDERKYLELEYAKKQTEMIAFKSQVNPHFMYNTFECIRGMALYYGKKDIAEVTQSLAKLFRYNVKGEDIVTVREILENLQEYAKIIHYRFMGKYEIQEHADPDVLEIRMPKMLVQPLVENAVLHGLEPHIGNGRVEITIQITDVNHIRISIVDNGCGMEPTELEQIQAKMKQYEQGDYCPKGQNRIGILNVYQRIQLFYGHSAEFFITSETGRGTEIQMILPVQFQQESCD